MTWHRRRQSTAIEAKGIRLGVMAEEETSKRTRKSPQERRAEVLDAAVQLISERGFNGISIQDVADRVGISKQGVLRYVENKDKMLALVYDEYYGQTGTPEDFFSSGMPGSDPSAPHFPAYLRYLVKHNSRRRMMVQLFTVLSAESPNPDHPLHDEFMGRMEDICAKPWKSWMAFSCGGCANRKWTCVRNGPKWRICCFPRPSGMHTADFMCVPHTFGGDLTATLILLIFYCGSA